ncbi:MAG: hypothetical protein IKJ16_03030 [Agathobacter sp.]|nr:hypothetical protein [Agathobacter sp.]
MKRNTKIALGIIGAVCMVLMLISVGMQLDKNPNTDSSVGTESGTETEIKKEIQLPYELEDGKLQVQCLFQSTITNPDSDGSYIEDLASLEVTNTSKKHLQEATIQVVLDDGKELEFFMEEIPAGKSVWAFELSNKAFKTGQTITQIKCKSTFAEKTEIMEEQLEVLAEETLVSITNKSDKKLNDLELEFHCLFDKVYYGGKTYKYQIDTIKAGEHTSLDVWECYLGIAEVVKIER